MRPWLRSWGYPLLLPVAAILFSLIHLIITGWSAVTVVGTNLPNPLASSGLGLLDLAHPTSTQGRVYDLTITPSLGTATPPAGSRVRVQLASNGRTRILIIRPGHPLSSRVRSIFALVTGRARLEIAADREWIDLGQIEGAAAIEKQIVGLLPGPFGFFELNQTEKSPRYHFAASRPEAETAQVLSTQARYQIIVPTPVPWRETLARLLFFPTASWVPGVTGLLSLVALMFGSLALARGRFALAVTLLVSSLTLFHAVLRPPLQGEDETSHAGTIEGAVVSGSSPGSGPYPLTLSRAAQALEQDRVQHQPDEPLPVQGKEARRKVVTALQGVGHSHVSAPNPPGAVIISAQTRGPLFYQPIALLAPILKPLSVLDRLSVYRLVSAGESLLFFSLGVALLSATGVSATVLLLYGLVALFPYSLGTVATCSNYSPAIGLGALIAAGVLTAVISTGKYRFLGGLTAIVASITGVWLWPDFASAALVGALALVVWGFADLGRKFGDPLKRARAVAALLALVVISAGTLLLVVRADLPARMRARYGPSMPSILAGQGDLWVMLALAGVPTVLAVLAVLSGRFCHRFSGKPRQVRALRLTLAGAVVFIAAFLLTPYTTVPYERARLSFPAYVLAHNASFWSNNFSWDQDRLFWKFYWGAFGWHDCFYPDAVYAIARWGCVALFLLLPVLSVRFAEERPLASNALILISGVAVSLCIVTEVLRYLQPINTWGRFLLPYLPLAALPVLSRIDAPGREKSLRVALQAALVFHVWTAIFVLGRRYFFAT